MKLPTIPPGLAGKIVKYRPLSEPIRLQDLEDSARSQAWKKIKNSYLTCDVKHRFETEAKPTNFHRIFDFYTVTEHPDTFPVLLGELGVVVSVECWALVDINESDLCNENVSM